MKCPWCGSPVILRGNRWECGYCGDSGLLGNFTKVPKPKETNTITNIATVCWIIAGVCLAIGFLASLVS